MFRYNAGNEKVAFTPYTSSMSRILGTPCLGPYAPRDKLVIWSWLPSPLVVHMVSASRSNAIMTAIRFVVRPRSSLGLHLLFQDSPDWLLPVPIYIPRRFLAGGNPGAVALHIGNEVSKGGNPAGASYHLGMKLQDKDFFPSSTRPSNSSLPVSEYFPVGIHGAQRQGR